MRDREDRPHAQAAAGLREPRRLANGGQSTVEYALVLCALVATLVALAALWHAGRDGTLLRLAREAASHALSAARALAGADHLLLY